MRSKKTLMMLMGMALAVLALAAPASASLPNAQWTETVIEEGVEVTRPISGEATVGLEGTMKFESTSLPGNGYECDFDGEAKLIPGFESDFVSFGFDKGSCQGQGLFQGCTLSGSSASFTQDMVATESKILDAAPFKWASSFGGGCGLAGSEFSGTVTSKLKSFPGSLTNLALEGTGAFAGLGGYKITGDISVGPAGVYGVAPRGPEWTKTTESVTKLLAKKETVSLEGNFGFESTALPGNNFECGVTGESSLSPGNKGEISNLKFVAATCIGHGIYAGCQLQSSTVGLSTGITAVAGEGAIFSSAPLTTKYSYKAGCPFASNEMTNGKLTATLTSEGQLSNIGLSGTGTMSGLGGVKFYGSLSFLPAGVYSIG